MKVVKGIRNILRFKKPVVALGVFDGVHRGHRVILKAAVDKALKVKGTSIALTFWPHPRGEESLYSLEHRLKLVGELGIDVCVVINFNRRFAAMPAEDFVENILIKNIGAHYIFIGENFRFGKDAEGGLGMLELFAKRYNFGLKAFSVIRTRHKPISSTLIRSLIKKGDIHSAEKLLGRPVSILGTVIKGASFAKSLGFPTANIDPHHEVIPPDGVYSVRVMLSGKAYGGACYIGPKPRFLKQGQKPKAQGVGKNIEVHIFNFNNNIYGKILEVQFLKKIRKAKNFNSISLLTVQIKKDILAINSHHKLCRY
jgi:riboflavin kinase / FMN adenylyltransferase